MEDLVTDRPWSSTAPPGEFRTYISAAETIKEFTVRAVILGALFGLLFGAITVYVGLRAGLTVSASIPIAVLSISILRAFGRSTILENNIVQTTGSAGESLAAGVMFTLPALIFLGFGSEFTFWRIFPLALLGGWLGVLFMIPLRRQLIVKEHGNLTFPEGTACADVLVAGHAGDSIFRSARGQYTDLSLHHSHTENDAGRYVAPVHPANGSGSRGRSRINHFDSHDAHHHFRPGRRLERCARGRK